MPLPEPFVVHCHVPKTGGSALNQRLLFPRYGTKRVLQLYRHVFERSSRLPLRHRSRAMRVYGVAGHVPFGYVDALFPQALYISVFRDPIDRFLSFVNFVLATEDHAVRRRLRPDTVARAKDAPDDLIAAILGDRRLVVTQANTQTRLAAGSARLSSSPVTAEHLALARHHIAHPRYLVGVQHDLDGFLRRTATRLPSAGKIGRLRKSVPERLAKRGFALIDQTMLQPATLAAVRDANRYDMALWEAVLAQHAEAQSAPTQHGLAGSAPGVAPGTAAPPQTAPVAA